MDIAQSLKGAPLEALARFQVEASNGRWWLVGWAKRALARRARACPPFLTSSWQA